jgi:geranylgeranyl pyrophosphate synthase
VAARRPRRAARPGARSDSAAPASRPVPPPARGIADHEALRVLSRAFERYLTEALPPETTAPARLHAAIRYSVLSPGKRLRPLLTLTACEAVGGEWTRALPAAAALECAHAFSLVHDDLPAMDDDDFRRGRPTTHKKFGEATGILAGDALLALAFDLLTGLADEGVPPERVVGAVRILATACGASELIGGQALDLEAEGRRTDGAKVRAIHARKTGGLMSAALALGALAGGAAATEVEAFARLGRELGVAFQIHDDLLNREASLARLGKRAGTDDARGKATYPRAVGEAAARAEATRLFLGVLEQVRALGPRAANLGWLVLAVAERDR